MKKIEFSYYDWEEFEQFLDQLPDKDASKLIATIQNNETHGLIIAQQQLWEKSQKIICMKFNLNVHRIFNKLFISKKKGEITQSRTPLRRKRKKHQTEKKIKDINDEITT